MYPFLRHPIPTVRLSAAKALHAYGTVDDFDRMEWMFTEFFSFHYQNLVLEERSDIRDVSFSTLTATMAEVESIGCPAGYLVRLEAWYGIVMTPIGLPFEEELFVKPDRKRMGYNVDKSIMAGDMSLLSVESVQQNRIAAAKVLGLIRKEQHGKVRDVQDSFSVEFESDDGEGRGTTGKVFNIR